MNFGICVHAGVAAGPDRGVDSATGHWAVLAVQGTLVIESVVVTNSIATITWASVPGLTYQLQYISDPTSGSWTVISPNITATDTNTSVSDSNALPTSQRFYRILLVQ